MGFGFEAKCWIILFLVFWSSNSGSGVAKDEEKEEDVSDGKEEEEQIDDGEILSRDIGSSLYDEL